MKKIHENGYYMGPLNSVEPPQQFLFVGCCSLSLPFYSTPLHTHIHTHTQHCLTCPPPPQSTHTHPTQACWSMQLFRKRIKHMVSFFCPAGTVNFSNCHMGERTDACKYSQHAGDWTFNLCRKMRKYITLMVSECPVWIPDTVEDCTVLLLFFSVNLDLQKFRLQQILKTNI